MPPRAARALRAPSQRDRTIARRLCAWFADAARDLPWRRPAADGRTLRDPWRALVAEAMLQQTQVSRVAERFDAFMDRFPTPNAMARADEADVLLLWSGLGYYRRARSLHACARAIVGQHSGEVPKDAASLRELPGVGRYTAGAVASIAFGDPEPLVDGNVARVLQRLDAREGAVNERETVDWAWDRAASLVAAADADPTATPALLNEGLMELGATVCTPRNPDCPRCPLARSCRARREGVQDRIPAPKAAPNRSALFCASVLISDDEGRLLIERRPSEGLWGGLWQAPTLERQDRPHRPDEIRAALGVARLAARGSFPFATTHRQVTFSIWRADLAGLPGPRRPGAEFVSPDRIAALGLSTPQRRILLDPGSLESAAADPA